MGSKPTNQAASLQIKARLARFLLKGAAGGNGNSVELDPYAHAVLELNGVVKGKPKGESGAGVDLRHLVNSKEAPDGPLLCVRQPNESVRRVIPASVLIFDTRSRNRARVVEYLMSLSRSGDLISERTLQTLGGAANSVTSKARRTWQRAAVGIARAIDEDLRLSIAGLRQSLAMNLGTTWEEYYVAVLRPSYRALDGYQLQVASAAGQEEVIQREIGELIKSAPDLWTALGAYFRKYGYVPLSSELSISELLRQWRKERTVPHPVYDELWSWADSQRNPLARFHIVYLLIDHPELIPSDRFAHFWHEMAEIVFAGRLQAGESATAVPWAARCLLATHFCQHIEVMLPGSNGEIVANAAWSLANALATVLDDIADPTEAMKMARHEHELSANVWRIVRPAVVPHPLRTATLLTQTLWSTSILCHLGSNIGKINRSGVDADDILRIEENLKTAVLGSYSAKSGEKSFYAFEEPLANTVNGWAEVNPESSTVIQILFAAARRAADWEAEPSPIAAVGKGSENSDLVVCQALRISAYLGRDPSNRLWEMMQDEKWRDEMLLRGSDTRFALFTDAILQAQLRGGEKWRVYLPHFFASACEKAGSDEGRRRALFSCTIIAAISGDTTSSIERLLKGEHRESLRSPMLGWRSMLQQMQACPSAWASAKVRGALSALRITR